MLLLRLPQEACQCVNRGEFTSVIPQFTSFYLYDGCMVVAS